jgi:hypothetical protein
LTDREHRVDEALTVPSHARAAIAANGDRDMRNLIVAATLALTAAAVVIGRRLLAEADQELATAPLWPRSDGSFHSFGEIWDWTEAA